MMVLLFGLTSCNKWKKDNDKKEFTIYYSEDYKDLNMTIVGVHTSDIEGLWIEYSDKFDTYVLRAKSEGKVYKEIGSCVFDLDSDINFIPNAGSSYIGTWAFSKDKYTIPVNDGKRNGELTFTYKEVCWK